MQPPADVQFTAAKDFFSEETRSQYCAGLSYTVRHRMVPNKKDPSGPLVDTGAVLAALLPQWVSEGKVVLGVVAGTAATVAGTGTVT